MLTSHDPHCFPTISLQPELLLCGAIALAPRSHAPTARTPIRLYPGSLLLLGNMNRESLPLGLTVPGHVSASYIHTCAWHDPARKYLTN